MTRPAIQTLEQLVAADGEEVTVYGSYVATSAPVKGGSRSNRPANRALVVLEDGTEVWLEPLDSSSSKRRTVERWKLDGHEVVVQGTIHRIMPSRGAGPLVPCLTDVTHLVRRR